MKLNNNTLETSLQTRPSVKTAQNVIDNSTIEVIRKLKKLERDKTLAVVGQNWNVGIHYYQTLPAALLFLGINDTSIIQAYNESLKHFKGCNHTEKQPSGDYRIDREFDTPLFSRDTDRLYLLAFETLLKRHFKSIDTIHTAFEDIENGIKPFIKPSNIRKEVVHNEKHEVTRSGEKRETKWNRRTIHRRKV